jgi:RimJ/RimL family protein N-acetyltransferase
VRPVVTLQTKRLVLRDWRDVDLPAFAALNADPRVMRHFPAPLTAQESDAGAGRIRAFLAAEGWGLWAVQVKGGADFVGFIGLSRPRFEAPFTPCVEVGWRLAAAQHGKGYATEGARAALDFAFSTLALQEVVSFTVPANVASTHVMEKLGMQRDAAGDFDHPSLPADSPLSRHVLYRLTQAGWLAEPAR